MKVVAPLLPLRPCVKSKAGNSTFLSFYRKDKNAKTARERLKKRYRCLLVNPAKLLKDNLPLWKEGLCNKVLLLFTHLLEVVRQAGGSQILRGKAVTLVASPRLSELFRLSYFSFCDTWTFFFKVSLVVVIQVLTYCNVASVLNNRWTTRLISKSQFILILWDSTSMGQIKALKWWFHIEYRQVPRLARFWGRGVHFSCFSKCIIFVDIF